MEAMSAVMKKLNDGSYELTTGPIDSDAFHICLLALIMEVQQSTCTCICMYICMYMYMCIYMYMYYAHVHVHKHASFCVLF